MSTITLKATAKITGWKEDEVPLTVPEGQGPANKFTQVKVGHHFEPVDKATPAFTGDCDSHSMMIYGPEVKEADGSVNPHKQYAVYNGIDILRISFEHGGKTVSGTFAVSTAGIHDKAAITKWTVIPESVTGDFVGLVKGGTGGYSVTGMETEVTLELELA